MRLHDDGLPVARITIVTIEATTKTELGIAYTAATALDALSSTFSATLVNGVCYGSIIVLLETKVHRLAAIKDTASHSPLK